MHTIPEMLYRLLDRDIGQPWARIEARSQVNAVAAAAVDATVRMPIDGRVYLLNNIALQATPGAGQAVVAMSVELLDTFFTSISLLGATRSAGGAALADWLLLPGDWIIPPAYALRFRGTFSAGGVANTVQAFYQGCSAPLGTIQLP